MRGRFQTLQLPSVLITDPWVLEPGHGPLAPLEARSGCFPHDDGSLLLLFPGMGAPGLLLPCLLWGDADISKYQTQDQSVLSSSVMRKKHTIYEVG